MPIVILPPHGHFWSVSAAFLGRLARVAAALRSLYFPRKRTPPGKKSPKNFIKTEKTFNYFHEGIKDLGGRKMIIPPIALPVLNRQFSRDHHGSKCAARTKYGDLLDYRPIYAGNKRKSVLLYPGFRRYGDPRRRHGKTFILALESWLHEQGGRAAFGGESRGYSLRPRVHRRGLRPPPGRYVGYGDGSSSAR